MFLHKLNYTSSFSLIVNHLVLLQDITKLLEMTRSFVQSQETGVRVTETLLSLLQTPAGQPSTQD